MKAVDILQGENYANLKEEKMLRRPAVAGHFYPRNPEDLKKMIEGMVTPKAKREKAVCVISPHAGFIYSGPVAGAVFSSILLPEIFVLLGPSHRRIKPHFAVMKDGSWETPLGEVPIEADLAERIMKNSRLIEEDSGAHSQEHSLEVQLPFIQFFQEKFSIVPISISISAGLPELDELARALSSGIKEFGKDVLIVASSDMSHYISQQEAEEKDFMAIKKILAIDPQGLFKTVQAEGISMCGFQAVTAALMASKALGAKEAELIKYQTSGDQTGDYSEVVGYAGLRIS